MKSITLWENGKHIKVDIEYSIFDSDAKLLDDNVLIKELNSRRALEKYLGSKKIKFKRANSSRLFLCRTFCVYPTYNFNGVRYIAGKKVWYIEI